MSTSTEARRVQALRGAHVTPAFASLRATTSPVRGAGMFLSARVLVLTDDGSFEDSLMNGLCAEVWAWFKVPKKR